jgi:hypothetical protein
MKFKVDKKKFLPLSCCDFFFLLLLLLLLTPVSVVVVVRRCRLWRKKREKFVCCRSTFYMSNFIAFLRTLNSLLFLGEVLCPNIRLALLILFCCFRGIFHASLRHFFLCASSFLVLYPEICIFPTHKIDSKRLHLRHSSSSSDSEWTFLHFYATHTKIEYSFFEKISLKVWPL